MQHNDQTPKNGTITLGSCKASDNRRFYLVPKTKNTYKNKERESCGDPMDVAKQTQDVVKSLKKLMESRMDELHKLKEKIKVFKESRTQRTNGYFTGGVYRNQDNTLSINLRFITSDVPESEKAADGKMNSKKVNNDKNTEIATKDHENTNNNSAMRNSRLEKLTLHKITAEAPQHLKRSIPKIKPASGSSLDETTLSEKEKVHPSTASLELTKYGKMDEHVKKAVAEDNNVKRKNSFVIHAEDKTVHLDLSDIHHGIKVTVSNHGKLEEENKPVVTVKEQKICEKDARNQNGKSTKRPKLKLKKRFDIRKTSILRMKHMKLLNKISELYIGDNYKSEENKTKPVKFTLITSRENTQDLFHSNIESMLDKPPPCTRQTKPIVAFFSEEEEEEDTDALTTNDETFGRCFGNNTEARTSRQMRMSKVSLQLLEKQRTMVNVATSTESVARNP